MLTYSERLILWNQYEVLKKLEPENAKSYGEKQTIVGDGIESLYDELNQCVRENGISQEDFSEVCDMLDMFRSLHFACRKLSYWPPHDKAKFEGFDGNHDHPHYGLALFLRRTRGAWAELADRPDNSHSRGSIQTYRRMLKSWLGLPDRFNLGREDIDTVCGV